MGEHGIRRDSIAGRRELERRIESRRTAENDEDYKSLRRGWCLGGEAFRKELLEQMDGTLGAQHYGEERRESAIDRAERIVGNELRRAGWQEDDLLKTAKGHRVKVQTAILLRAETTVTYRWIARRLMMGSPSHAANLVYAQRGNKK